MNMDFFSRWVRQLVWLALLPFCLMSVLPADANPTGGTASPGTTFSTSGSTLDINQTTANAFINWQTFDINQGETVNFNQPSSSSVTWNYIGESTASTINGALNANGYVFLENPNGFTVGGSATITAHGLIMSTASTPNLNLAGGGAWSFDAAPPSAQIVNYGKINITGGGSAYLIAADIVNNGSINAPNGKIGLYDGETVLVSTSPNGQGLSAKVTLPQGSVDNEGNLTADGGSVIAQARVINQNGIIQANSAQNVNGTIELLAGDSVSLGANSVLSAQGAAQGVSSGGSVTIQAGNTFSDQSGSTIDVAGGAQGGNGGQVEMSAPQMGSINTVINGQAQDGFTGGTLTIDPANIWLDSANNAPSGYTFFNISSFSGMSQINLQADNNIILNTPWQLASQTVPVALNLTAGNDITLNSGSQIFAGNNWTVNMTAGTAYTGTTAPASGSDGIYLDGGATLQTQNGTINLWAANEVQVGWSGSASKPGVANPGTGAIRTEGGGGINVTTEFGDVNSGSGTAGFDYLKTAPYYTPDVNLGGISTAAGGNVDITAGGNVVSFPAYQASGAVAAGDPGTGAFGPEPGNVTINAGQNIYGNFTVVNGTGEINAGHEIGSSSQNVALSLVNGSWILNAGSVQSGVGDIYLQEVRDPNGVFNNTVNSGLHAKTTAGYHLFDYGLNDSVTLNAGNSVNITGYKIPRLSTAAVPMILPPTLIINAGAGGVVLDQPQALGANLQNSIADIILFPSPFGNLEITTTDGGGLIGGNGSVPHLLMSDSGVTQWLSANASVDFGPGDHATVPPELGNEVPVMLNISGNMENVELQVSKLADITVGGDMVGCFFLGENLNVGDATKLTVNGEIFYESSFTSVALPQAFLDLSQLSEALPSGESFLPPGSADFWYTILQDAILNPATSGINDQSYKNVPLSQLVSDLQGYLAFGGLNTSSLEYNPASQVLTATGPLASSLYTALTTPYLYLPVYGPNGFPMLDSSGHFVIDKVAWMSGADISQINTLNANSQSAPSLTPSGALVVGGTGEFDINAGSINLGNSYGILTLGNGSLSGLNLSYSYLTPYITSAPGATINIMTSTLTMPSSTIAALGGGTVNITCNGELPASAEDPLNSNGVGVSMDLGSPNLADFEAEIMNASNLGLGIYTAGGGAVNVTAKGTINIDTSRIATFNGGNINITSQYGDVNAGSGGTGGIPINVFIPTASLNTPYEYPFANGIVADTLIPLPNGSAVPGAATKPGNITVITPEGSIYANLGGILQESLGGTLQPGPTVTLEAGTPNPPGDWKSTAPPLYVGNVELGNAGAIGGTINVEATGKVSGLLISSQNANITSQTVGNLTVLSVGTATVSSQSGSGGVTIIGGQGVNATGVGNATLLGQSVSVNGNTAQSTLGSSATATATSTSAAGQTSGTTQQQVAGNDNGDDNKKKKPQLRKIGRVTVILASAQ
jgi:filamentous hemagglutinin family protein